MVKTLSLSHYQHLSTTSQDSFFLRQHPHRLTVTIRAYDSNFCFDIWRVTNADYLFTYLLLTWSPNGIGSWQTDGRVWLSCV